MMTEYRIRTALIAIMAIWAVERTSLGGWALGTSTIYDALESRGLPKGLFPKGVKEYSLNEDGRLQVRLEQACNAKFESELHYDQNVSGQLSYGQIRNLTGISAQDLFLWFPVKGIRVDVPSSGIIYFDVGVVYKQFSVSIFENPPDCVAASHPPELQMGRPVFNVLAKKLEGILRYRFKQGKNAREVM